MKLLKKLFCLCCVLVLCTVFLSNAVLAADKVLRIAFIGDSGIGKSALRAELAEQEFEYNSRSYTTETNRTSKVLDYYNERIQCFLFDTCGDPRVRDKVLTYRLANVDIAVFIIDLTRPGSLLTKLENDWFLKIAEKCPDLPILVVGTKADLAEELTPQKQIDRVRTARDMMNQAGCHNVEYVVVSALSRQNLGDPKRGLDEDNTFWGRIRYMIHTYKMYDRLGEAETVAIPQDEDVIPKKKESKCLLQ